MPTYTLIDMIYTYKQCLEKYGSDYQINKAIKRELLFKIEKGIYADTPIVSTFEIIVTKYPNAIFTLDSAFYYHNLTDVIPEEYWIATNKSSRELRDKRIKQIFIDSKLLNIGVVTAHKKNITYRIYDKERMLIELLRYKNKLPYDYYKEILSTYRDIIQDLDIERIQKHAKEFPCSKKLSLALEKEVF